MTKKGLLVKVKSKRQKPLLRALKVKLKKKNPSIEEENLRNTILYQNSTQHT